MIPSKCIFFQRLFCIIYLVAGITPLHAQRNYAVSAIPLACLPAANAVVRFADTRYTLEGPGKAVFSKTIAVTVLNESGKNHATLIQPENKFIKIKTMQGRLYSASGLLVRTSSKSDIQEQSLSDRQEFVDVKLKGLIMEYPSYPFTVEYTLEYSMEAFFLAPSFTIQHLAESVESATFTLAFPKIIALNGRCPKVLLNLRRQAKATYKSGPGKLPSCPPFPNEVFTPFFDDSYIEIEIAPEQVLLDKSSGNFSNWLEVGRFFYDLNKDRDQLSPQMQKQVADLTASLTTPQDKIKVLYRYLQEQTRYVSIQVGVGGWQTFDAQFVEEKKYGDCKALTNFMKAMLKSAGITAHQALVYAGEEGAPELSEDLPLPQFNHVILYIPEVDYWLGMHQPRFSG
ncbi:MAG: transglutaminase domain-containing protein [Saprospiraceae bacterium]|nr:transglutaminase domain-containing protein [Saprospiraceae bacterium]